MNKENASKGIGETWELILVKMELHIKRQREYMIHKQDCNLMQWGNDLNKGCTCGMDDLMSDINKG